MADQSAADLISNTRLSQLSSAWPIFFDPPCQFPSDYEDVTRQHLEKAAEKMGLQLSKEEMDALESECDCHEYRPFERWETVYPLGFRHSELFLVVEGVFARVFAQPTGDSTSFTPACQVLSHGAILSPSMLNSDGQSTTSMCVCVRTGGVIRIRKPEQLLKSLPLWRAIARASARDAAWIQQELGGLRKREDRVAPIVKTMAALKDLRADGDHLTFTHPASQTAMAEFLGISDNTLRPHLNPKDEEFGWNASRSSLRRSFVEAAKAQFELPISEIPSATSRAD